MTTKKIINLSELSDAELLVRICEQSDSRAIAEIERRHERCIRIGLRNVRQQADRDDIRQIYLLDLYSFGHTFKQDHNFAYWFTAVIRNAANRYYRGPKCKNPIHIEPLYNETPLPAKKIPETITRDNIILSKQLLEMLPKPQRDVLYAHYILGESVKTYAERVGIPRNTAETRRKRGVSKLRDLSS